MTTVTPLRKIARLSAGIGALILLPTLLVLPNSAPAASVTINVDTTKKRTAPVPANFVGIFDASNIGKGVYNPSTNTHYSDYLSLIKQMGVKHWRVDGGSDTDSINDQFFTFVSSANMHQPCVQWGLWLANVNNLSRNNPDALHIISTPADSGLLDAFSFGNETNFNQNLNKDQYIPCKRNGQNPNLTAIYSGADVTSPPTWNLHTTYHEFDVVTFNSVVYQEMKNSLLGNDPGSADPTSDLFDGVPIWTAASTSDPSQGLNPALNITYTGGVKDRWREQYDSVQKGLTGYTPKFVGPDAGWDVPMTQLTPSTTPWTLQFAVDESTRLEEVTQHVYTVDGGSNLVTGSYFFNAGPGTLNGSLAWAFGNDYLQGDEVVWVVNSTDHVSNINGTFYGTLYRCNQHYINSAANDITPDPLHNPNNTYWTPLETAWVQGAAVTQGQVVKYNGGLYQCIANGVSSTAPSSDTALWVTADRGQYAYPGPHQLSVQATSTARLTEWANAYTGALGGASGWPSGLPFRMSEFSPFSGPGAGMYSGLTSDGSALSNNYVTTIQDNTNCFCSALVGFEMFHWWAAHGAAGVDPIAGVWQINSPIFQTPYALDGASYVSLLNHGSLPAADYVAEPYAYAWPAFNVSAQPGLGYELPVDGASPGVTLTAKSPSQLNLTAYAVFVPPNDVYVTIFNKTYAYDHANGAETVTATIAFPNGNFVPKSFSTMTLDSGATSGQACAAMTAELGGSNTPPALRILSPTSSFPPAWPAAVTWNNTVTVNPFTATILHISSRAP